MLSDDYNSWQETPQSEAFKDRLDTEVIVFEGTFHPPPHLTHPLNRQATPNSKHTAATWPNSATGATTPP